MTSPTEQETSQMSSPATEGSLEKQPATALALQNVLYEKMKGIAYVTLNRPKVLNALNTPTWADLRAAFEDARDDEAVRGVILTGAGDKAFIAGADVSDLAHVTALQAEQSSRFGQEVLDLIENLGKPVVAAINGFALGGGCETAMACTIRIEIGRAACSSSDLSSRFGQEVLDLIENLGKPVVAAINGFALGGGCETAMACTIRI